MAETPQLLAALTETLDALRESGRLSDEDSAFVAMAEGLAAAVAADPTNAALWREYRAALSQLKEAGADASDDDTQDFIVNIQTPGRAKVRDTKKA